MQITLKGKQKKQIEKIKSPRQDGPLLPTVLDSALYGVNFVIVSFGSMNGWIKGGPAALLQFSLFRTCTRWYRLRNKIYILLLYISDTKYQVHTEYE